MRAIQVRYKGVFRMKGAGYSSSRIVMPTKMVRIWTSGTLTMIATNGAELGPGLQRQSYLTLAAVVGQHLHDALLGGGVHPDTANKIPEELPVEDAP